MTDDTPDPDARAVEAIRHHAAQLRQRDDWLKADHGAPDLLEMVDHSHDQLPDTVSDFDYLLDAYYELADLDFKAPTQIRLTREAAISMGGDPDNDARYTDIGGGWVMLKTEEETT